MRNRFIAISLILAATAGLSSAQVPSYPDFSSTAGLALNGNAAQSGSTLRLTEAVSSQLGSAWFDTPVSVVGGFETTFSFRFTIPGTSGGDGMAFVLHNDPRGTMALSEPGSAMGYGVGTSMPPVPGLSSSLAIEVDTWDNAAENDPSASHVSAHTNGAAENNQNEDFSMGAADSLTDMGNSQLHAVRVRYVPGTLEVYVDDLLVPLLSVPYDFNTGGMWINGTPVGGLDLIGGTSLYVGFTAANGGAFENHDVVSWEWGGPASGALCFGDGTGAACPCGNVGGAGEGCANSTGPGAILSAGGAASLTADTLSLTAVQSTNQPGIFFQGNNTLAPGLIFGDGLRCCGGGVVRIVTVQPAGGCAASDLSCGTQIGGMGGPISQHPGNAGLQAGDTRCYQWWYRDPGAGNPCGIDFFNLSNAVELNWGA